MIQENVKENLKRSNNNGIRTRRPNERQVVTGFTDIVILIRCADLEVMNLSYDISQKLKIVVTTRALFKLEKENEIFEEQGRAEYEKFQIEHEDDVLNPGAAYSLIAALLKLNNIDKLNNKIEVIIMSRNGVNTSLRVYNSFKAYDLDISRGIFTGGGDLAPYLEALKIDLFLTANSFDAQAAINRKIPAATLLTNNIPEYHSGNEINEIRIAFDGDAVLFSEESEKIYKEKGLEEFAANEAQNAKNPMSEGPFAKFLKSISEIQNNMQNGNLKIRTALVTARNAPAHERVVRTLRAWNVTIDEAFFLGGISKTEVLKAFGAHIFFDDQTKYTEPASSVVPSGTVPYQPGSTLNIRDNIIGRDFS
jgi:5'-nucleotidase